MKKTKPTKPLYFKIRHDLDDVGTLYTLNIKTGLVEWNCATYGKGNTTHSQEELKIYIGNGSWVMTDKGGNPV